jgi:RB1-inducible coiled-coil protein 1
MVLYVFLVDTGSMVMFDMNLAVGRYVLFVFCSNDETDVTSSDYSVAALKEAISIKTGIAEDKQVLLINGGEALAPKSRVCSYSAAGTDSSPIFLFNKAAIEQSTAPVPLTDYGPDADLSERVESCISMQPHYNTVVARTEMAKQMAEISVEQVRVCEKLVHDQHLQHQGWRAALANLEDVIASFTSSWNHLQISFDQFFDQKNRNQHLLQNFRTDLQTLVRIPLIAELGGASGSSLFDWINKTDNEKDLEVCMQAVMRFEPDVLDDLRQEADSLLSSSCNSDMKGIKGLEERLYGLDKLMADARKLSAEEKDLSNALCRNQQRLTNIRDPSIIPDLCHSHKTQLQVMLKNHQQLRDIRRRCVQAKRELSLILHQRLGWIMSEEKKLAELLEKVIVHRENIRRLRNHLEIVQQIHLAPQLYVSAVIETVRRRFFSKQFLEFAASISSDSCAIFNQETKLRQEFTSILSNHFLSTLFPGFGDNIPSFAIEAPAPFDTKLPHLDESHVQLLRQMTPELFSSENSHPEQSSHNSILLKYLTPSSSSKPQTNDVQSETEIMEKSDAKDLIVFMEGLRNTFTSAIRDIRHQNSECGSIVTDFQNELRSVTHNIESEVNELMSQVKENNQHELDAMSAQVSELTYHNQLLQSQSQQLTEKLSDLETEMTAYAKLKDEWNKLQDENESKRRIILEHEVDMVSAKEKNDQLESEVDELKSQITHLNSSLASQDVELKLEKAKLAEENKLLKNEVDKLKLEVEKVKKNSEKEVKKHQEKWEVEKNRELKVLRDKLKAEHKLELENLRIRFRLSSSVERAQDSLTMEPAFDREVLQEQLSQVKDQLAACEERHANELQSLRQRHRDDVEAAKQAAFSVNMARLTEDKDKEIRQLKSEITALTAEVKKLTGVSPVPWSSPAYNAIDSETKISRLESLIREKDTRITKLQDSLYSERVSIIGFVF